MSAVTEYLDSLPEEDKKTLTAVRRTISLDVIGESVARYPVDEYIRRYEAVKRK